ncbi:zf-TFIIB domain-containing protein [Kovacikia minuta CCNUW1]|uniref:zf-TFIIB domain-containing protein n=1 Tax=Kovacikia minuta TaxID=2931930 RepID=UPI001CCCB511|nr:zf-TFIIB domain-containing protein [Kovacikia minuta]UBF26143.1 zf-TFIIB domain-containing protein [Kovacikia minuta CCNUW1]
MECPKDRKELIDGRLMGEIPVKHCPGCEGTWIPPEEYANWQEKQPQVELSAALVDHVLDMDSVPSPFDTRAALCPDCNCYLARGKVNTRKPFYVERCPNCKGVWCDRGEWEVLEKMGLHQMIGRLFSPDWQSLMREREQFVQERRATTDKLGPELANRIFELAELLEQHPNGDFGVAYLMRRFDK